MTTLSEWQEQHSVFSYLTDAQYLQGVSVEMMEFLLGSMYGQRKVRTFLENKSAEEIGGLINQVYGSRWQEEASIFQSYTELEGDTVATSGTERTTDTNQVNKTSGFDGSELVDDSGANINGTDATNATNATTTREGLLAKAEAVRKRQFHERICEDIARFITLPIY